MKILLISYYFPPLNSVGALRPYAFARDITELGHDVTVLTANKPGLSGIPDAERFEIVTAGHPWLDLFYKRLGINDGSPRTPGSGLVSRLKQMLRRFRLRRGLMLISRLPDPLDLLIRPSFKLMEGRQFDCVIAYFAPRYCLEVALRLKQSGQARFLVCDFRDMWTESSQFKGVFPFTLWERRLERRYLQAADLVCTISQGFAASLQRVFNRDVEVVPNGFNQSEFLSDEPLYLSETQIHLVYTGTLYSDWSAPRRFLEAMDTVLGQSPELQTSLTIHFVGNDLAGLEHTFKNRRVDSVLQFHGLQERSVSLAFQRRAHAVLLFEHDFDASIPTTKLFEYIASGSRLWRIAPAGRSAAKEVLDVAEVGHYLGWEIVDIAAVAAGLLQELQPGAKPVSHKPTELFTTTYERTQITHRMLALLQGELLSTRQPGRQ